MVDKPLSENDKPSEPAPAEAKPKSPGETHFDKRTYGWLAGVGVFVATMPVAYWAKYGSGAKWYNGATQKLVDKGMGQRSAEMFMNTMVLGSVGNLAIIPIKYFEDHKAEFIEKHNQELGHTDPTKFAPHAPPPSWWSLIKGRIAAYTAVGVALEGTSHIIGGDKFAAFENKFAEYVVCKPLGQAMHDAAGQETKAFRAGKIAALDVFATASAAALLYFTSRAFDKKSHQKKDAKPAPAAVPATYDEPTPQAAAKPKVFTDGIAPSSLETKAKPKAESFTEALAAQKEASPSLSA